MKIYLAKTVLPITGPPIENGGIAVEGRKISDIGKGKSLLRKFPNAFKEDLGNCTIMPGLINVHAHLELSNLKAHIGEHADFFGWIKELIRLRREVGDKGRVKATRDAIEQAVRTGTTCIGDISGTDKAVSRIVRSGLKALIFLEVIGLDGKAADDTATRLEARLKTLEKLPARIRLGLSPHATYSVSSKLFKRIRSISSEHGLDIAVHVSETYDEYMHIKGNRSGMDEYMSFTGWAAHKPNRGDSPVRLMMGAGLDKGLLAVHAVHVTKKDMKLLAGSGASVAHCPRSNHMLNVGTAPVREMIDAGINVGIGTDSLASNIDMDMWEEMRFAYLVNRLSAEQVIRMATINGARALHMGDTTGSLEVGKDADFISVTGRANSSSPAFLYRDLLFNTRQGDVRLTVVQGKPIHISEESGSENGL